MPISSQDGIVLGIVAIAALFLVRRFWRALSPKSGAGCASGCGTCPAAKPGIPPTIVPLDALKRTNGRPRRSG